MDFDLRIQHHDDRATVHVSGEIDLATCPRLREALAELVDRGTYHLVVDLEQVGFLDSSGIGVLVNALRRVREHGGSLRLVGPSPHVRRVLDLTGVTTLLTISDDGERAAPAEPMTGLTPGSVAAE